jgi:prepilin-type N-terminal cleavage/methylation domain-containing protein
MIKSSRIGFTLVELLVVVAIILLILAMIIPAVQRVREAANKVDCANHLRTMGQGINLYLAAHQKYFPTGGGDNYATPDPLPPSPPRGLTNAATPIAGLNQDWGWMYQILPYVGHETLWQTKINPLPDPSGIFFVRDAPGDIQIAKTPVDIYFCPSRRSPMLITGDNGSRAVNDYAGNMGAFTPILETGTIHDP